jgi:hypothetical protein
MKAEGNAACAKFLADKGVPKMLQSRPCDAKARMAAIFFNAQQQSFGSDSSFDPSSGYYGGGLVDTSSNDFVCSNIFCCCRYIREC